jgi:hypothetical protein
MVTELGINYEILFDAIGGTDHTRVRVNRHQRRLGPGDFDLFFLFVELFLAGLLFLTGYAVFDPWLQSPTYLQRKWPKRPGE